MLLRESSNKNQANYNLASITRDDVSSGVPFGDILGKLTQATIANDWLALAEIRPEAEDIMGRQATVDALVVAAAFNGITRVADATGIPLDDNTAEITVEMRDSTGIDRFAYAEKSTRYDQ